jgi:asparagine synthase (glutamine-hydrolysing)
MCGIFAIFRKQDNAREKAVRLSKKLRHRGPDWSGVVVSNDTILCHERLSIVGVESGAQPLVNEDSSIFLAVNGEIYNHVSLRKLLKQDHVFATKSDCEIILHLWEEMGPELVHHLDGMFSFVLYDSKKDILFAARDHVGITTLYYGYGVGGSVWFASEMKALNEDCAVIKAFPPGCTWLGSGSDSTADKLQVYYNPTWYEKVSLPDATVLSVQEQDKIYNNIRTALEKSVHKRLMTEVPYGVLLSGGLDSSLLAAIATRHMQRDLQSDDEDIRSKLL